MRMPRNPNSERDNPCLKEHEMSLQCLNDNNYNRNSCQAYFDNYNMCKKFWGRITSERRSQGILPYLPPVDERADFKREYFKGRNQTK